MTAVRDIQIFDVESVTESVEPITVIERGRSIQGQIIRRHGLARYIRNGKEVLADAATFCDYGRQGMTVNYTQHNEVQPTEEERAAGRQRIQDVVSQALADMGIW